METTTGMYLEGGKERMKKLKISILLIGIILLIMALMFSNVYATDNTTQELNFKDPNLQKAILEEVGKTQNDKLTMADIENHLQNNNGLSLMNSGITDLTGLGDILEKYKVEWIYLNDNNISNISELSKAKSLKLLWIWNNKIEDVTSLANLTELESFKASDNKISDISALKNLKKMNSLILENNNIRDISVIQNFPNLEVLMMSDNQIEDISAIKDLKKLSYITFDNNKIKDISCMQVESIVNSSDDVDSYSGFGHIVTVNNNYIDFSKPQNQQIVDRFKKAGWKDNFEEQDGDVFQYMPQKELPVTAQIDIVNANEETQVRAGDNEDLYCLIDVPTDTIYKDCYYRLYFKEYVGKNVNVEGLGTFTFDKKGNTEIVDGEQYIYKCKIANPEIFYRAGIKEYSVTYTVENTNKTYTTKFEIKVTGLEVKTYEVKADKKVGISLTGAMGSNNSLEVNTIDKQDETYVEMASMLNVDKENMDIYAYDINVEGQYEGELTLTFGVGQEYNGRKANVLHMKKDNTTEKFEVIVENGKVTVKVNGLSPFMIAIENTNTTETPKEETKKEHKLDETPKTGETFAVTRILSVIALISLAGIVITNKYKK